MLGPAAIRVGFAGIAWLAEIAAFWPFARSKYAYDREPKPLADCGQLVVV